MSSPNGVNQSEGNTRSIVNRLKRRPWSTWGCARCRVPIIAPGRFGDVLTCPYCGDRMHWIDNVPRAFHLTIASAITDCILSVTLIAGSKGEKQ